MNISFLEPVYPPASDCHALVLGLKYYIRARVLHVCVYVSRLKDKAPSMEDSVSDSDMLGASKTDRT